MTGRRENVNGGRERLLWIFKCTNLGRQVQFYSLGFLFKWVASLCVDKCNGSLRWILYHSMVHGCPCCHCLLLSYSVVKLLLVMHISHLMFSLIFHLSIVSVNCLGRSSYALLVPWQLFGQIAYGAYFHFLFRILVLLIYWLYSCYWLNLNITYFDIHFMLIAHNYA